jgi:hypothetical protein
MRYKNFKAKHKWLTPIILTTQKAEIRRVVVQSQSILKTPNTKRAGEVAGKVLA